VSDETRVTFRALDGLNLVGTLTRGAGHGSVAAVLVHGGGVTRDEGGFFTRLALGLADAGIPNLRFDLRGHGESDGKQEDLTLACVLNDIRVAIAAVRAQTAATTTALIGQSFGGGICAYYTAKRPTDVQRLVLLCPQLNYKRRTIDSRPYWVEDHLADEQAHDRPHRPGLHRLHADVSARPGHPQRSVLAATPYGPRRDHHSHHDHPWYGRHAGAHRHLQSRDG
jgi:pimeloyl-ACP methyl ester carboxylesterase